MTTGRGGRDGEAGARLRGTPESSGNEEEGGSGANPGKRDPTSRRLAPARGRPGSAPAKNAEEGGASTTEIEKKLQGLNGEGENEVGATATATATVGGSIP